MGRLVRPWAVMLRSKPAEFSRQGRRESSQGLAKGTPRFRGAKEGASPARRGAFDKLRLEVAWGTRIWATAFDREA